MDKMRKNFKGLFVLVLGLALISCNTHGKDGKEIVFRVANGSEPQSLDPARITGVTEVRTLNGLFEGLMVYDGKTAKGVSGVAQTYELSDDGLTYIFHLRPAKWSNGDDLTALDFEYSIKRALSPETASKYAFMAYLIKGAEDYNNGKVPANQVAVKALDAQTLVITLNSPAAYFIDVLAQPFFAPVHKATVDQYGEKWTHPEHFVGNGAFVLDQWQPQDKIELKRNIHYWDAENVKLDRIIFYSSEDESTNYNMYKNGELDWLIMVPPALLDDAKMNPDFKSEVYLRSNYYLLNIALKPFDDVRVRKAMAMAIDRKALVDKITRAGDIPAYQMVPNIEGYPRLASTWRDDIQQAKILLADAGYPDGKGFPVMTVLYNTAGTSKALSEYVQSQWKEHLGIDVILQNKEWKVYLSERQNRQYQIARAAWTGDYADPMTFLDMFLNNSDLNDANYNNPQYDALVKQAQAMREGPDRLQLLSQAEDILINQDMAVVPIYYEALSQMIDTNKWGGWTTNVLDIHSLKTIYKK
jgi:oligopeptide transport system substrate-binding protein